MMLGIGSIWTQAGHGTAIKALNYNGWALLTGLYLLLLI